LLLTTLPLVCFIESGESFKAVKFQYKTPTQLNCSLQGDAEFFKIYKDPVSGNHTEYKLINSAGIKIDHNMLTIQDPRRSDIEASYYCRSKDSVETFDNQIVPFVAKPDKVSLTVTEGGYAEMHCKLLYGDENQRDVTWKWLRNGTEVLTDDRVQIDESSQHDETKLNISRLVMDDKGEYECLLINEFGEHSEKIVLRVKDALAVLWPFLAIVVEVIVLCLIILIYEKKCANKGNRDADEAEDQTEQTQNLMGAESNGQSDLKKRTAKA